MRKLLKKLLAPIVRELMQEEVKLITQEVVVKALARLLDVANDSGASQTHQDAVKTHTSSSLSPTAQRKSRDEVAKEMIARLKHERALFAALSLVLPLAARISLVAELQEFCRDIESAPSGALQ